MFLPFKKATVLIPSGPPQDENRKHLFVLLTDPIPWEEENGAKSNLIVPISSIKSGIPFDKACVINAGEHPFIVRKSFVLYRYSRIVKTQTIQTGVENEIFIPREPVSQELFVRICKGLFNSPFVPGRILRFIERADLPLL